MKDRLVVHSEAENAAPLADVLARLKSKGVTVLESTPHMLLVEGSGDRIEGILDDFPGWGVSRTVGVSRPGTRERVLRRP